MTDRKRFGEPMADRRWQDNGHPPPTLDGCAVLPPMLTEDERARADAKGSDRNAAHVGPGDHAGTEKAKHPKGIRAARRTTGDRFAVLNGFVDCGMTGLSKVEIATWLVLYRDTRDGTACTSEAGIAKRIGCSKRAVTRALGRLRRRGLLVQVFRGGINRGPSRYRVLPITKPPKELGKRGSL